MNIILDELKKNENFLFTRIDYKKNRPQLKVKIDRDKSSDLQVTNSEIGRTLEILLAGRKINTFIETQSLKSIVAFLNSKGGTLVIGVNEKDNQKKLIGCFKT